MHLTVPRELLDWAARRRDEDGCYDSREDVLVSTLIAELAPSDAEAVRVGELLA